MFEKVDPLQRAGALFGGLGIHHKRAEVAEAGAKEATGGRFPGWGAVGGLTTRVSDHAAAARQRRRRRLAARGRENVFGAGLQFPAKRFLDDTLPPLAALLPPFLSPDPSRGPHRHTQQRPPCRGARGGASAARSSTEGRGAEKWTLQTLSADFFFSPPPLSSALSFFVAVESIVSMAQAHRRGCPLMPSANPLQHRARKDIDYSGIGGDDSDGERRLCFCFSRPFFLCVRRCP